MLFIQIGFLGALAALAIPILVHLVFRQRPRRVDLGTLRFLRVVLEHNARRRRVMRWLLLSLRLACVALLAFLFARPYLLAAREDGKHETVAILIDRSASMEQKLDGVRAIERATTAARGLLQSGAHGSRFEIAFFDQAVHPLMGPPQPAGNGKRDPVMPDGKGPAANPDELAKKLTPPEACHGATDYGQAMEWARDVLAKAPPGPRTLHVFTDFQRSGLAWSEVDALPDDVATHLHDLGRAAVNNVAVTEARPDRSWLRPDERTSLSATVYNGGPFTASELPVVLKLKSRGRTIELREQARLEPGAMESLRFDLPALAEGLWEGVVEAQIDDDLPRDNSRHVAILASPAYQVLLVDGSDASSPIRTSTYFLEMALRLAPPDELYSASPFEPRQVSATQPLPQLDPFDVVVLSNVGDLRPRDAEAIVNLVERGGGLLVFCGENVTQERTAALGELSAGTIVGVDRATDLPLRFGKWDAKHPIFSAFSDPQLGDLARLSFSACTEIQPSLGATVLAAFGNGKPAVLERRVGQGTVVWFTSTCDRQWSDWTRSRLYLPLVYQLLGYQTGLAAGGKVRHANLEGDAELPAGATPGVLPQEGYTLVVNGSLRESETERCSADEFIARFGLKTAKSPAPDEDVTQRRAEGGTELIDSEIWPWLATLLLAVVLMEGLVANRTAA